MDRKAAYRWCAQVLAANADNHITHPTFIDEADPVLREVNRIIRAFEEAGVVPPTAIAVEKKPEAPHAKPNGLLVNGNGGLPT